VNLAFEEVILLVFQDEMWLVLQNLRTRPIKSHLPKERATSKMPVFQDVKWNTYTQASDFVWKHHGKIQTVLEVARLKQTPFEPGCRTTT
jgi:hypothetical protein